MKLYQYPYQTRKVEAHNMKMVEIKEMVLQAMVGMNAKDNLVRLVNTTLGEVLEYDGMDELILADLNNSYEVHVTRASQIHLNSENRDVIVVVFDDDVEI